MSEMGVETARIKGHATAMGLGGVGISVVPPGWPSEGSRAETEIRELIPLFLLNPNHSVLSENEVHWSLGLDENSPSDTEFREEVRAERISKVRGPRSRN